MPAVLENCVDSSSFYAEIERRREASNRSALIGGAAVAGELLFCYSNSRSCGSDHEYYRYGYLCRNCCGWCGCRCFGRSSGSTRYQNG